MKKKIINILGKDKFFKYKIFLFANIFNFFLEFISLISIPIFVASIISPEVLVDKIHYFTKFVNLNSEIVLKNNIVISSQIETTSNKTDILEDMINNQRIE